MRSKRLLFVILCCLVGLTGRLAAQGTEEWQVSGPCSPFPCPAPPASQIDTILHTFDTTLYNTSSILYDDDGVPYIYSYKGDTLVVHCGWIYVFYVEAGAVYEWNTDISQGVVTPYGGNGLKTKITLFYDDFQTSAIVSQSPVNTEVATLAAGLAWKANYTGYVGVMVTRGDDGLDVEQSYCACNGDDLLLRFDKLANPPTDKFFIWGRYGTIDTIPCDDDIHYIYDSGLGSLSNNATGDYSNNENGYLVLHPDDPTAKLKLWGDSKMKENDTLFIYNGDLSQNPNLIPYDTIVGQHQLGSAENPIFMSQPAGAPITLRMLTDSSCTWDGLVLMAKCCLNPGMPTDLTGHMTSDTTALLTWNAAAGNEIVYNWSLYSIDSVLIMAGDTTDTVVNVNGLNPNECYFFTISVLSECSNESGGDDDMDVVYSNTFCYPYFVTLGDAVSNFSFAQDSLYVPEGAYVDSSGSVNVIIHESQMRVCYGQQAHICYSFPYNINMWRQMTWKSGYQLDTIVPSPLDTFYVSGDTNVYVNHAVVEDLSGCFYTGPLTENGYVILDVWSEGHSLARAILHIIVDPLPNVYITYNNQNISDITTCESSPVNFFAHGAMIYNWTDSLGSIQSNPFQTLSIQPTQNNAYYVLGTSIYGCEGRDTIRVHVNPLPDLQYTQNYTICKGDSVLINVGGIQHYTWVRWDTLRWDETSIHTSSHQNRNSLKLQMRNVFSEDSIYRVYSMCYFPVFSYDTLYFSYSEIWIDSLLDSLIPNQCTYTLGYLQTDHHIQVTPHVIAQGGMSSMLVAPLVSTDYEVYGTDTNGCASRTHAFIHVEVLPHPTILDTTSSGPICPHDTATLAASVLMDGNYTFQWIAEGSTTVLSTDTVLQFVPDSTVTVYFTASHSNGCDTTVAFFVEMYPLLDITLSAFPDTMCPRQSSTLTMNGSGISEWHWDDGSSSTPRVVTPEAESSYFVVATDANGCSLTEYVSLYLYPMPLAENIANDSLCIGSNDTIVLSGTASHYNWLTPGLNHNDYGDTLFLTPYSTADYSVAYDNEYGCWDTAQFTVFVYNFPQPQISNDTTICRGDSLTLIASGGNYFLWDDPQHSTTSSIVVSPATTTTYNVLVYNYLECAATATVQVNVIPYFDLSISASNDSVCPNTVVVLTASGGSSYQWNGDPEQTSPTYTVQADSTMVVSLSASNAETSCSRTVYDTIVVFPPPEFQFVAERDTLCYGDTLTISLVGNAATYQWSTGDNASMIVVSPTAATIYTVTAYSEYQCTTTHQYAVEVNPLPADYAIHVADHVCFGDSIAVNVSPAANNVQFIWNYPGISVDSFSFYYTPLLDIAEDYTDTLTLATVDENGCRRVHDALITVYALPRDTIFCPPSICRGDTVWLHASGQYNYVWFDPIDVTQNTEATVWHVPTTAQTYSLKVTNDHNCFIQLTKDVTINELPTVIINTNGQLHFCNNQEYLLTATGAQSYVWSDGQTGASIMALPMEQTVFSVTGTDANGCVGTHMYSLDVDTAPVISLNVFPLDTICALDTFTIYSEGHFDHILWNTQDTTLSITRSDIVNTTTFTATATSVFDGIQCNTTESVQVYVYPVPQLHVLSNSSPSCSNDTGVIMVSGADSYQWRPHPHLHAQEGPMAIIYPEPSTENYIDTFLVEGVLNGFNCNAVLAVPFVVDSLPNLSIELISSGVNVCLNDTITLKARGAYSYKWYLADSPQQVIATGPTLTVVPEQTTTYMIVGYTQKGCVDTIYYTVTINGHPELTVSVSDSEVCYGFPVQLTAVSNATLFSWDHDSTLDNASSSTPVALPLTTTTYHVTVTDANTGCASYGSATVIVHPSPIVASDAPIALCLGDTLGISLTGATSYLWYEDLASNAFHSGDFLVAAPNQMPVTNYYVIGTDQNGCRDTLPIPINVHPLPEIYSSISYPGYLCKNGDQFLGITVQSNASGIIYQWSSYPTDPSMSYNQNVAFVSPDTSTMYVVYGYYAVDGVACHAYDTAYVVVYSAPTIEATIYPTSPCDNIEVTMSATGAYHYIWYNENQLIGTGSSITILPEIGMHYMVAGSDTNNCIGRDTVEINTIHSLPVDSIIGPNAVCFNTPTVLNTTGQNHCEWIPLTGLSDMSDSSVTVTISENISYDILVTDEYGCQDTLHYTVTVLPLPELVMPNDTVLCAGDELTFRVTGAISYVWEDGSTNDFRVVNPTVNTTTYSVTGTNQFGCVAADSFEVAVYPPFDLHIVATRDTFCIEDNAVTLTAYGAGDTYVWNTGSTDSVITVYPTATTTYTLTAFNTTSGCRSSFSHELVRMVNPDVHITSASPYLCLYDTVELSVALADGESILWNTGESLPDIWVAPSDTAIYSAVVTNAFGCQTSVSHQVNVLPLPQVNILQSDSVLCYGQVLTLTAVGDAEVYQWSTGEVGSSIVVTNVTDDNFVLTGISSALCRRSDTAHVIIHPLPTGLISGPSVSLCTGDTAELHLSSSASCVWLPTANVLQSDDSTALVLPTGTEVFTAVMTNEHGCVDSTHIFVSVYEPLPLTVTADTLLCVGSGTNLTVHGSWNYQWSNGFIGSSQYVEPQETTTYTVSSTDLHGCVTEASITVNVHPDFVLSIYHDKDTICIGDSVALWFVGAADVYHWSTGDSAISITSHPVSNSVYSLWAYSDITHCVKTIFDTIVVIQRPIIGLSTDNVICAGDTLSIWAFSDISFDYHWIMSGNGALISTVDSSVIVVSPQESVTYTYYATNQFCTLSDSVEVEVSPLPQVHISSNDSVSCYGETVTLTASGNANYYQWSTGEVGNSISFIQVMDTEVVLTGYSEDMCRQTDTIDVIIRPLPTGVIYGSGTTICSGDTAVLHLSTNYACTWLPIADVVQTNGTSAVVQPAATEIFTTVMTNEYGCVDSTHYVVNVYEPLPLVVTADTVLCYGGGTVVEAHGSWNYTWSNGYVGNSQYVDPTQTTLYTVSSTDTHDCITTASVLVTVLPDYVLSMHHSKDTICVGDSVTLWVEGAADHFFWSTGDTTSSITVAPVMDAIYSAVAYNSSISCSKTVFDTIIVIPYPLFLLGAPNLICAGDTMTISAVSEFAFDYYWTSVPNGSLISDPDSPSIVVSPQQTTTYSFHATNHFCTLVDSLVVEVAPLPVITLDEVLNETCFQNNGLVSVIAVSNYPPLNYYWSTGEQGASVIQNLAAGLYSLTVTDVLGCSSSLNDIEIVNIPPPEIDVITAFGSINGGDGSIDIDVPNYYGSYTVSWYFNSLDNYLPMYEGLTSINGLDSGYYYVMVTDGACSVTQQIFIPHDYFGQGNIYVPNSITPSNEDGINDYFHLYYVGDMDFESVYIFNRWGEVVFTSEDVNFQWDGKVNGKIYYSNVYNVLIRYRDSRGTLQEIVTILVVM